MTAGVDEFSIKNGVTWYAPPDEAKPDKSAPPVMRRPEAQGLAIDGSACMAVGSPSAEVGRNVMVQSGIDWYITRMEGSTESNRVQVCLFDPDTNTWDTYKAVMHRPTYNIQVKPGAVYRFTSFRVLFTELQRT